MKLEIERPAIYIGIDDTDTLTSRGTGHLARLLAADLAADHTLLGVTRHQLLVDPRVPYTAKNSSAAIHLGRNGHVDLDELARRVRETMAEHFNPGSDPGLCIAQGVPPAVAAFGQRTQRDVVTQADARTLAADHGIRLAGLGGTEDGIIGALAAVGLAASGSDGRYVLVGRSRELSGLRPVADVLDAGIAQVRTIKGRTISEGLVLTDKLRPARRGAQPIAMVEWCREPYADWTGGYWLPLKLD